MPVAIPLIATAIIVGLELTSWAAFAVMVGASILSSVLQKKPGIEQATAAGLKCNTRSSNEDLRVIYGKVKVGGNDVFVEAVGPNNKYLWIVQNLGEGECEGIAQENYLDQVFFNDELYTVFGENVDYWLHSGSASQTYDTNLHSAVPAWTDNKRHTCYIVYKLTYNQEYFQSLPIRTVVLKGQKVYDFREETSGWSDNPALCLYDYMTNSHYGMGFSASKIDITSWTAAANYCDTQGWTCNMAVTNGMKAEDVRDAMCALFRGQLVWYDGKYYLRYADLNYESSVMTINDEHIARDASGKAMIKIAQPSPYERPDGLRIGFNDPDKGYVDDYIAIGESEGVIKEVYLIGCTNKQQAADLGVYMLERAQLNRGLSATCRDDCAKLEPHDPVTINNTALGLSGQVMRVDEANIRRDGLVDLALVYEEMDLYNDDYDLDEEGAYTCTLPDPRDPPPSIDNESITLYLNSGTGEVFAAGTITIEYDLPESPFYKGTEVWLSTDNENYYYYGFANKDTGGHLEINGLGVFYDYSNTVYIKLVNVNDNEVKEEFPETYNKNISVDGVITKMSSFYGGQYDFWGGNVDMGHADTKIVLGGLDATPKIALGGTADSMTVANMATYPGFYADGDGNFRGGGSTHGIRYDHSGGIFYVDPKMRVGSGETYIDIDGTNYRIRSSNYVSGFAGAGFTLEPDLLETGNIGARGILRTAVFQKDVISAVGGNLLVRPADVLSTDMTDLDASTLTVEGNETFAVGDFLRIKDGANDEWFEVTNAGGAPTYVVTRDMEAQYAADTNPEWKKGATVVNYGQSGDGGVYMTASETNAPYMSIFTHAGAPWDTITTRLKLGNLNGFLDYEDDLYGIAIGETDAYMKYDPTNGMRIKGSITVTGGDAATQTYADGVASTAEGNANTYTDEEITGFANTLGNMAYEDLVESAKLGTTIIDGGYIKTSLLDVDAVIVGADVSSFAGLPSDENLLAYWSCDDGVGTQLTDNSGNGQHLTASGTPTFVSGVSGKAIKGTVRYEGTPGTDLETAIKTGDFYISFWWTPREENSLRGVISFDTNTGDDKISFAHGNDSAGNPGYFFAIYDEGESDWDQINRPGTDAILDYDTTYHFVVVVDRTNNILSVYINGELDKSEQKDALQTFTSCDKITFFNGANLDDYLDEVRIYSGTPTANEVKALSLYPSGNESTIRGTLGDISGYHSRLTGGYLGFFDGATLLSSFSGTELAFYGGVTKVISILSDGGGTILCNVFAGQKAGDYIIANSSAIESTASNSYVKLKEITVGVGGTLRIKFYLTGGTYVDPEPPYDQYPFYGYGKIYRNGDPVGTERSVYGNGMTEFSEDITGWANGDLCQLYIYIETNPYSMEAACKEFRICSDNPVEAYVNS